MNRFVRQSCKTLLVMCTWMFIESSPFLITQSNNHNDWARFWTRVRSAPAPNLLSSCPWEYSVLPNTNHPRVQIFQFATFHCIDLHKSGAHGPIYDHTGKCKPVRFPVYGCGSADQSVIVAYTCVYSAEILVNKRGSNTNSAWMRRTTKVNTTAYTRAPTYNIKDRTISPTTLHPNSHKPGVNTNKNWDHSGNYVTSETYHPIQTGSHVTSGTSHHDQSGSHVTSGTSHHDQSENHVTSGTFHHDQSGSHAPALLLHQYHQQNVMPPFLNSALSQKNTTGLLTQNVHPPRDAPPQTFFGNHNPQLGMPPVQRPMSLMELMKGNVRSDTTNDSNSSDP